MKIVLILILLCIFWIQTTQSKKDVCTLTIYGNIKRYVKDGDLILGGVFQLFQFMYGGTESQPIPISQQCYDPSPRFLRHFLAVDFAVEEINKNTNILPNISLGYDIFDSCFFEGTAVEGTMKILSGGTKLYPNYDCHKNNRVAAFIGHLLSSSSQAIASLLKVYDYPQVSYGSTDPIFKDRTLFPFFFRTISNKQVKNTATVKLLKHFGWTWVGIVYSVDDSNQKTSEELIPLITKNDGCVAFTVKIFQEGQESFEKALHVILNSSANVIIVFSPLDHLLILVGHLHRLALLAGKVWILPDFPSIEHLSLKKYMVVFNGSLVISPYGGDIPNFKEFLYKANPDKYPNRLMRLLWTQIFKCEIPLPDNLLPPSKLCKSNLSLRTVPIWKYDVNNFRLTYSVYIAVYAVAHALHNMYLYRLQKKKYPVLYYPGKLIHYLKHVSFETKTGDQIYFDKNGETPGHLDFINWLVFPEEAEESIHVGKYLSDQLYLNDSNIKWPLNMSAIPRSACTESCPSGFRKCVREGEPVCCYDCAPCSAGEISNTTDMESCIICPEEEWPNVRRDKCVPKIIVFLSFSDPLGITFTVSTAICFTTTVIVLCIFTVYKDTPIVKASNRDVSYILLFSLMVSFLSTLMFIGQPNTLRCISRQVTFCIVFTVSVSSTVAKNIAVLMAFRSTKPNNKLRLWHKSLLPKLIILVCCLSQIIICTIWLVRCPPFPELDTHNEIGQITLQCNEGSTMAFYIALGYIGLLAFFSFVLAFCIRKLPDQYNEAHHITFSMLVFCSVWVTFIPVYLRTKGKYMVAVELFAILTSSAGLLVCIFIPKCYTIILRPEMNIREKIRIRSGE